MRILPSAASFAVAALLLLFGCASEQSGAQPASPTDRGGPPSGSGPGQPPGSALASVSGTVVSFDGSTLVVEAVSGRQTLKVSSTALFWEGTEGRPSLKAGLWAVVTGSGGASGTVEAVRVVLRTTRPSALSSGPQVGPPSGSPPGGSPPSGGPGGAGGPPSGGAPPPQGGPGGVIQGTVGSVSPGLFTVQTNVGQGTSAVTVLLKESSAVILLKSSTKAALKAGVQVEVSGQDVIVTAAGTTRVFSAVRTLDRNTTESGLTAETGKSDTSGILVDRGARVVLNQSLVMTSGPTSSDESSSFYGLNAAVLVRGGSDLTLKDSRVVTTGRGANGVFSSGGSSLVTLDRVRIEASGAGGHAVMASGGGSATVTDSDLVTSGANSAPLATDRGGGTLLVTGGTVLSSGSDSPGLYSTGLIDVKDGSVTATGAEAAVVEGSNSIALKATDLKTTFPGKPGVMIYQSFSGDAEGQLGRFTQTGGSLSSASESEPLFYVTNTKGIIKLSGVAADAASGLLVRASAGRWGTTGQNGGRAELSGKAQKLTGNLSADELSTLSVDLAEGSVWTGAANTDGKARSVRIVLDKTSRWEVTGPSTVTFLATAVDGDILPALSGNFDVTYDRASNPALGGRSFRFSSGTGRLVPR